jgi:hypothetical protein
VRREDSNPPTYGLRVTIQGPPVNKIKDFPLQNPAKSCKIRNPRATRIASSRLPTNRRAEVMGN